MTPLAPAQRVRRWRTYLVVWAVHRVLGLGFGALILLASVTGGLLVLHHELELVVERDRHVLPSRPAPAAPSRISDSNAAIPGVRSAPSAAPSLTPALPLAAAPSLASGPLPVTALVAAAAPHAPAGYRPFRYLPPAAPDLAAKVLFLAPDGRTRWSALVDPYTAAVRSHGPDQSLFTPWLLALHMHLFAGGWGYLVTGCAGVGLVLLGLSGLYLYRDRLGALWRRPFRLNRGLRVACSDLHKWLGVVSIYFTLVLGVTGAIYSFNIAPGQLAAPKPLAAPFAFAQHTPVEPLLAFARDRFPAGRVQRVAFPTTAKAPVTVLVLERSAPVWRKFSRIEFDPVSGAVRAVRDARDATVREKFSALLAPLHMGIYGSAVTQWLYVLGGFAPALLVLSGGTIWYLRTRRRPAVPPAPLLPAAAP